MKRSTGSITLVLVGSALLLGSCSSGRRTADRIGETTGTRSHRGGYIPGFGRGTSMGMRDPRNTAVETAPTASKSGTKSGGFGSTGRSFSVRS